MALKSDKKPFMISGRRKHRAAGGAGDVTWTLNETIEKTRNSNPQNGPSVNFLRLHSRSQIWEKAMAAGVGNQVYGNSRKRWLIIVLLRLTLSGPWNNPLKEI